MGYAAAGAVLDGKKGALSEVLGALLGLLGGSESGMVGNVVIYIIRVQSVRSTRFFIGLNAKSVCL